MFTFEILQKQAAENCQQREKRQIILVIGGSHKENIDGKTDHYDQKKNIFSAADNADEGGCPEKSIEVKQGWLQCFPGRETFGQLEGEKKNRIKKYRKRFFI